MRQWTYQTCNQFGYYQTTDYIAQPFANWSLLNLDFYYQLCAAAFDGWNYDPEAYWTNTYYGDTRIAGTNIIFPTGTIDPWHVLGVVDDTVLPQSTEQSLEIVGTAHCADLRAPSSTDLPALTEARQTIADFVTQVLSTESPAPSPASSDDGNCDDNDSDISNTIIGLSVGFALTGFCSIVLLVDKFCIKKGNGDSLLGGPGEDRYISWK